MALKPFHSDWDLSPCPGTQTQPKLTVFQLRSQVSGPNEAQVPDISLQKEFSERVIGKKWIYSVKNTPQTEGGLPQRASAAPKCGVISFYGLGNFIG